MIDENEVFKLYPHKLGLVIISWAEICLAQIGGRVDEKFIDEICIDFCKKYKNQMQDGAYIIDISIVKDTMNMIQDKLLNETLSRMMKDGDVEPLVDPKGEILYRLTEKGKQKAKDLKDRFGL